MRPKRSARTNREPLPLFFRPDYSGTDPTTGQWAAFVYAQDANGRITPLESDPGSYTLSPPLEVVRLTQDGVIDRRECGALNIGPGNSLQVSGDTATGAAGQWAIMIPANHPTLTRLLGAPIAAQCVIQ